MTRDKYPTSQLFYPILANADISGDDKYVKIGVHVVSNLPLQVSLYFNLIFFPFWLIIYSIMVPLKFSQLSKLYQFIFSLAFATTVIIESLRLYIGYLGNLKEKISELAGFWLITVLLQTPLQMFLLLSSGLEPSLLESIVQTIMCIFLFSQLLFGIIALRNAAKHSVLSFNLSGVQNKDTYEDKDIQFT